MAISAPKSAFANASIFGIPGANGTTEDRVASQFWMNIGYEVETSDDEGQPETVFVSLRQGVALDGVKEFDVSKIRNAKMAALRQAQNEFHAQIMNDVCGTLVAGEARIVARDATTGICVEVRRINGDVEAPLASENPLSRKLTLA